MEWTRRIDGYCERVGPEYWAEPVNALTNLAFLCVAVWLWRRAMGIERLLCAVLFVIGLGSWLFHTHATVWAAVADTAPIAGFILVYVFAANRRFWGLSIIWACIGVLAVLPYMYAAGHAFSALPFFEISAVYWPVAALIGLYAIALQGRLPVVARGLAMGAGLLSLSLAFRSVDGMVCETWPLGTHFAWHLLNAVMLGWMITVLRRHRLDARGAQV